MAAYLRSLFGGGQSTTPAHGRPKTRRRTDPPYSVYTPRSSSVISSSPLRYPTYASRYPRSRSINRAASDKPHPDMQGRVAQFPQSQSEYVTPGSSRLNPSSSLYPGPVNGTPFVPSPIIPSPPRSKTSDDLPRKTPVAQNKAWAAGGVNTGASGSSTCVEPSRSNDDLRASSSFLGDDLHIKGSSSSFHENPQRSPYRRDGLRDSLSILSHAGIWGSSSSLDTIRPINPQLRPYPSSTALQSNGSIYGASFMTSPSYDSLIEVSNDIAETRHGEASKTRYGRGGVVRKRYPKKVLLRGEQGGQATARG